MRSPFFCADGLQRHKSWVDYFGPVFDGTKMFEVRKNDRKYAVGDVLHLKEWDDRKDSFTGRECQRRVVYILEGVGPGCIAPLRGVQMGFVVMGLIDAMAEKP